MKLTLKPIKEPKAPQDRYFIMVKFMHGDADFYTYEEYKCSDEHDFRRVIAQLNECPQAPSSGGDADVYSEWGEKTFKSEDFVPWDKSGYDCAASYDGYEAFYYNSSGIKFEVEVEEE